MEGGFNFAGNELISLHQYYFEVYVRKWFQFYLTIQWKAIEYVIFFQEILYDSSAAAPRTVKSFYCKTFLLANITI